MFPDLRLLISATVATFFLAATAGLYASLRITQDQIARNDGRPGIEDSPIARISATWPAPEPSRAAALRELTKIAKAPPVTADEIPDTPDRGDIDMPDVAVQPETPAVAEDAAAQHAKGSTGIAAQPESASLNQPGHPDIQGNIGEAPEAGNANPVTARPAAKKAQQASKKRSTKIVQRRKQIARVPEHHPVDPLLSGYPLYLTVPVTN